jgi:hypothetical protein
MHATTSRATRAPLPGMMPAVRAVRCSQEWLHRASLGAVLLSVAGSAQGYTATLTPASPKAVYLQVGNGTFAGNTNCMASGSDCYLSGGTPVNNATVNTVSVTVATAAVGNGTAQAMTTNSTQAVSYWDGYVYCTVPAQLYIGGFYRTTGAATAAAQVTATVPAALTNGTGGSIKFSQISWASSGNGDTTANGFLPEIFPGGTFVNGGTQTVGSMASNTWNESCWNFSYLNTAVPGAGTYTGSVLYTMTSP